MRIIPIILLSSQILFSQVIHKIDFDRFSHYEKEDWITYAYANNIVSIDIGVNNIYFATRGGGVWLYDIYRNEWLDPLTTSNGLRSNNILEVVYDHELGELYAQTKKGLDVYNSAFEYWQPSSNSMPKQKAPEYDLGNNLLPPFSRPETEAWPTFFPQENYTIMLDGTLYNPDNIEYLLGDRVVDQWHRMWIASNGSGIAVANLQTLEIKFIKHSIPAIRPKDVLVSNDDIWIGGEPYILDERGIAHWDYSRNTWTYYKSGFDSGIFSDRVRVIEKSGQNIYFGTEQGLLMYDPAKKQWGNMQNVFPIKNDAINDLCNVDNILFVATRNGLFSYNVRTQSAEQIAQRYINQTSVNSLARIKSDLYIATNYGIFKYNHQEATTELLKSSAAIADNLVEAVAADANILWFSGANGIGFLNTETNQWHSFPALKYSLMSRVNHIAVTLDHTWFATDDGLLKYDIKRDYWYLYTTKDGLTDNRVYRIETDGDYLWLATYGGVTLFCWNREGRIE